MRLSIIIPVLNEAEGLPDLLGFLTSLNNSEVIVVDGGSEDDSQQIALRAGAHVIQSERGRAKQMNAGALIAQGDILLFLHADTLLPSSADRLIESAIRHSGQNSEYAWGRFDVCIAGRPFIQNSSLDEPAMRNQWIVGRVLTRHVGLKPDLRSNELSGFMLRVVASLMNWRSRLTGIATGDQAMFVARHAFESVGGFPDQPLMEDVELSKRLRALSRPICLRERVVTSGRRWETHGVWRTIWLMWKLRWAYWRGADAAELARLYQ